MADIYSFTLAPTAQVRILSPDQIVSSLLSSVQIILVNGNVVTGIAGLLTTIVTGNQVQLTIPASLAAGSYEVRTRINLTSYAVTRFVVEPVRVGVMDADGA